jgi:hypothetical protein
MELRCLSLTLPRMDSPCYQLIVIRAWRESNGIRIRVLADGRPPRQWVVGSIAEAHDVMDALLARLLATADQPSAPPDTTE